ncbi:putative Uncharacterized MFS-type transporter [Streptomyces misionensis JCM 4497]
MGPPTGVNVGSGPYSDGHECPGIPCRRCRGGGRRRAGRRCARPVLPGAEHRHRLRRPADRLRGDRRGHRDARRRPRAERRGAVRVRVLRVLHHQPLRHGPGRPVGRPARSARGADQRDRGLRGGAGDRRHRAVDVGVHPGPGRPGARRRAGHRRAVRRRRPGLPRAAAPRDHGGVRGELGRALRGRPARLRCRHRAARLALGVPRHPGPRGVPAGPRPAADTPAGVRTGRRGGGRRRLRPAAHPARPRHLPRRRPPPVRRPGSAPPLPGTRRGRRRPAGARRPRPAAARHLAGRPRPARRRPAARAVRRVLHRRGVLRAADAGHPARAVADARRVLAGRGRRHLGAGVLGAVPAAPGAPPGAADDRRDAAGDRRAAGRAERAVALRARLDRGRRLGLRLSRHGPGDLLHQRAAAAAVRAGAGRCQLRRAPDLRRSLQRPAARRHRCRLRRPRRRHLRDHDDHLLPPRRLRRRLPADGGGGPGRGLGDDADADGGALTARGTGAGARRL